MEMLMTSGYSGELTFPVPGQHIQNSKEAGRIIAPDKELPGNLNEVPRSVNPEGLKTPPLGEDVFFKHFDHLYSFHLETYRMEDVETGSKNNAMRSTGENVALLKSSQRIFKAPQFPYKMPEEVSNGVLDTQAQKQGAVGFEQELQVHASFEISFHVSRKLAESDRELYRSTVGAMQHQMKLDENFQFSAMKLHHRNTEKINRDAYELLENYFHSTLNVMTDEQSGKEIQGFIRSVDSILNASQTQKKHALDAFFGPSDSGESFSSSIVDFHEDVKEQLQVFFDKVEEMFFENSAATPSANPLQNETPKIAG